MLAEYLHHVHVYHYSVVYRVSGVDQGLVFVWSVDICIFYHKSSLGAKSFETKQFALIANYCDVTNI